MEISTILASAVVASIVSGGFNMYFREVDYRYDYKKYILKKRQDAYEEIERNINFLSKSVISREYPDKRIHAIFVKLDTTLNPLDEYLKNHLSKVFDHRIWISHEMLMHFGALNKILLTILNQEELTGDKTVFINGIKRYDEVNLIVMQLQLQLFEDMKTLDKIKSFKKNAFYQ